MHMMVNVHFPGVPQTGQTLPLVSHGTTSFLVFSAVFGILLSISRETWLKMRQREDNAISIIEHEPDEIESRLGDLDVLETREQNEEI
jgi:cell division protein FtsW